MTYKHRDIVIAYMDGKQIQVKLNSNLWSDIAPFDGSGIWPSFKPEHEYRIKPKTNQYRVAQFNYHDFNTTILATTKQHQTRFEKSPEFVRWLTDWVEYERD